MPITVEGRADLDLELSREDRLAIAEAAACKVRDGVADTRTWAAELREIALAMLEDRIDLLEERDWAEIANLDSRLDARLMARIRGAMEKAKIAY